MRIDKLNISCIKYNNKKLKKKKIRILVLKLQFPYQNIILYITFVNGFKMDLATLIGFFGHFRHDSRCNDISRRFRNVY